MSLGREPRSGTTLGAVASLLAVMAAPAAGQSPQYRADAFVDPVAATLYQSAADNWATLDNSVLRYTALIQQRIGAAIRTPLKDRIVYRSETAVRAFWDHEHDAVVQVLGSNTQYPGRDIAVREGDLDFLDDLAFDRPASPGGDRLFLGLNDEDDDAFQPSEDDFWLAHPLASGADSLYRFESGDTLTLSLPDGRRLRAVQLDVLPRVADVHRITGTLWIEPESGALIRAVYRLSEQFDALREIPDLQEEEGAGSFKYVPGLFKPWTFDLNVVAIDYGLWDFKVWLPRSMRLEGEAAAGILKIPVSMDLAYQIESVTTIDDVAAESGTPAELEEVHFETRAEAMAFIAHLLSGQDGTTYEPFANERSGRESNLIVPEDRSAVANNAHLPPPIWEESQGFASDEDLAEYLQVLADLPSPTIDGIPWTADWGWARPDLLRYNRVEGPAIGGRFDAALGGPYTLEASGFFGFADLRPKARINLERATVLRRLRLGVYHELQATDPAGRYFGFGNSVHALLFGRDDGEYFRATGMDFTWRPPTGARESWSFRAYGERQEGVEANTSFALFKVWDGNFAFRPNVAGNDVDEAGAELRLAPWWGSDPQEPQFGLELYGHAARWKSHGNERLAGPSMPGDEATDYARVSAIFRAAVPLSAPRWRLGMEAGAGTTWGDAPTQRSWFMGGAGTVRGYPASALQGNSFVRGRAELARTFDGIGSASAFTDVGWAGLRNDFDGSDLLYGVGVGGSILDGLMRMDISHGLNGPRKRFRIDLYLDAIL